MTKQDSILDPELKMGIVELLVNDLAAQHEFYTSLVGLDVLNSKNQEITLGHFTTNTSILRLKKTNGLPSFPSHSAGLYHHATVFESRSTLALAVYRILKYAPHLYQGTADHLVSEAFYFSDPEGNGVELYFDKPKDTWIWEHGHIKMDSIFIDPQTYIRTYAAKTDSDTKKLGHIHLQVGDIHIAKSFYVEVLGFSITADMHTALFLSDGHYHHNIGMNIWQSSGAGKRKETLGLSRFEIFLSDKRYLKALQDRLTKNKIHFSNTTHGLTIEDPWGNKIDINYFVAK